MEVTVRGKHFHVPASVEERARTKLSRLNHYLPLLDDGTCEVDVAHEKAKEPDRRFYVHVNVSAHGVHLHAAGHADDPEAAIDHAVQVLTRQAKRKKGRLYDRGRQSHVAEVVEEPEREHDPAHHALGRVKRFSMKPMTVVEAMEQLEALGHDFYVFNHLEEEKVAVLYRRRAGDYGMILPELP